MPKRYSNFVEDNQDVSQENDQKRKDIVQNFSTPQRLPKIGQKNFLTIQNEEYDVDKDEDLNMSSHLQNKVI